MKSKKWTNEEIEFLKEHYSAQGVDFCSKELKRTKNSISLKASQVGVKRDTLWRDEEITFLKENYAEFGVDYCSKKLNKTKKSVVMKSFALNLESKHRWNKKDIDFINENYVKFGGRYCSDKLGRSIKGIEKQVVNLKIGGSRKSIGSQTKHFDYYNINPSVFINVATPEVAYILGLLYADGCVYEKTNRISVSCVYSDLFPVKWIFDKIGKWNFHIVKSKKYKTQFLATTTNRYIYQFLKENGYENKTGGSAEKILSNIPDNLKHYFFLGFLDGDGCFYVNKKLQCSLVFTACYEQDWTFVENLFKNLNITYYIYKQVSQYGKNSSIRVFKRNDITAFGNYIYNSFEKDKIGFKRKRDKFLKFLNKNANKTVGY